MPIIGNLSEFPLPEVLLLVGARTGRLRLLDIPEYGVLDIEISNGEIQTMHIGGDTFTETQKLIDKLGPVIQAQNGMFEFRVVPVSMAGRAQTLTMLDLALKLVCHVDEQTAHQPVPTAEQRHRLVIPEPEIWMDPELDQFFHGARQLLTAGASIGDLARHFQLEMGIVHKNLGDLRLLGLIEPIEEETSTRAAQEAEKREKLVRKNTVFLNVAHIQDRIRKLSSA